MVTTLRGFFFDYALEELFPGRGVTLAPKKVVGDEIVAVSAHLVAGSTTVFFVARTILAPRDVRETRAGAGQELEVDDPDPPGLVLFLYHPRLKLNATIRVKLNATI